MKDDTQLLEEFARDRSDAAFRELVGRHLPMVLATARRLLGGDTHLAQDVAQLVFTGFASKAATLPAGTVPAGWLYRHTCFLAANTVRAEHRRRHREKTAMEINALNDDAGLDARWQRLAPALDAALNTLDHADRDAIVLRYLGQAGLRSIGRTLGASEDAVQKRTSRALDKLRATLLRRGLTYSGAVLAATLEAGAAAPVPAVLADLVCRTALAGAAAVTTTSVFLAMIKSKTFLGVAASLAIAVLVMASRPSPAATAAAPTSAPVVVPVLCVAPEPATAANPIGNAAQLAAANPADVKLIAQLVASGRGSLTATGSILFGEQALNWGGASGAALRSL